MNSGSPQIRTISVGDGQHPLVVEWHATIESTMARSTELARHGDGSNRVVVADYQSYGRGTRGRRWIAPPGSCLMFSFMASNEISVAELQDLPLEIACLVASELRVLFSADIEVDPPNDLTIRGKKLAGILCQSHLRGTDIRWIVCGMGINTNLEAVDQKISGSTSLLIETGQRIDHADLLGHLLDVLLPIRSP